MIFFYATTNYHGFYMMKSFEYALMMIYNVTYLKGYVLKGYYS